MKILRRTESLASCQAALLTDLNASIELRLEWKHSLRQSGRLVHGWLSVHIRKVLFTTSTSL